jgi:phosphate transport system substrate-binding protein
VSQIAVRIAERASTILNRNLPIIGILAAAITVSCGGSSTPANEATKTSAASSGAKLNGAGATFPAPLYSQWANDYKAAKGIELNYAAIGSGGGIKQITSRTVDFGATDDPMKAEELQQNNLIQFPATMGGVVLAYNLPGFTGEIKLDGPTIADMFMGKEKKWNDPKIAAMNPGVKLPNVAVTPVYRSDSSGTSFIFTSYLSGVSPEWKSSIGADKAVKWPTGAGGKGNAGVAGFLKQIEGSIGYVEYSYAKSNSLPVATLKNQAGKLVKPGSDSFAAAAASAKWDPAQGFYISLTNQPGDASWPIVGVSFILVPTQPTNAANAKEVLNFFDYAFKNGGDAANKLDYVPIPPAVVDLVRQSWSAVKGPDGKPVWN